MNWRDFWRMTWESQHARVNETLSGTHRVRGIEEFISNEYHQWKSNLPFSIARNYLKRCRAHHSKYDETERNARNVFPWANSCFSFKLHFINLTISYRSVGRRSIGGRNPPWHFQQNSFHLLRFFAHLCSR